LTTLPLRSSESPAVAKWESAGTRRRGPAAVRPIHAGPLLLCVPKTLSMSRDQVIFVDNATGASLFSDAVIVEMDRFG
jgi:hypothetical protein